MLLCPDLLFGHRANGKIHTLGGFAKTCQNFTFYQVNLILHVNAFSYDLFSCCYEQLRVSYEYLRILTIFSNNYINRSSSYSYIIVSFRAVVCGEMSCCVYHLFVATEGERGAVGQRESAGVFCEEIHFIVGCNANMGGNPHELYVERTVKS